MTHISKLAIIAAVTAVIATPAFAQSFDPEAGSGNIAPFSYAPTVEQNSKVAVQRIGPGRIAARRSGLHAFAMVPGVAAGSNNDPALTGGGSAGYNQMLLQY